MGLLFSIFNKNDGEKLFILPIMSPLHKGKKTDII